jgi:hypothetical protein
MNILLVNSSLVKYHLPPLAQEITAQDAYNWTNGNVTFLGGAQEEGVKCPKDGSIKHIRCGHTLYIFPGIALGLRLATSVGQWG